MPKRNNGGDALGSLLDNVLAVSRRLETENLAVNRMQMTCGDLETPLGTVPVIGQTPHPGLVSRYAHTESYDFARFGREQPWPAERRALFEALQELTGAPVVCLANAFARIVLKGNACVVTVGTRGEPGWTNQNPFAPSAFDYLEAMAGSGGVLVDFFDPYDGRCDPPAAAKTKEAVTWADIRQAGVGERALALIKRPRDRLILLLAIHQRMDPAAISKLNLCQVTQKYGWDGRGRVYLKKRLVRKKAVADALLSYRRRDREGYVFCDPKEPLFRDTGKPARRWCSARLGTAEITTVLEHAAKRALKGMPPAPAVSEPPARPAPPLFWIADVEYRRSGAGQSS